jgi:serine protease AprX
MTVSYPRSTGRQLFRRTVVRIAASILLLLPVGLVQAGSLQRVSAAIEERVKSDPAAILQLIVTYDHQPGEIERSTIRELGGTVSRAFESIDALAVDLPGAAVRDAATASGVVWVSLDARVSASAKGGKGGDNSGVDGSNQCSEGDQGYSSSEFSGAGVTVAVLDSGLYEHPDLEGQVLVSANFVGDNSSNNQGGSSRSQDTWGHGTHVAGIIAGTGASSRGFEYEGVASGTKLVNVRVLERDGEGLSSEVIAGIDWVIENKDVYDIRVMNLSL